MERQFKDDLSLILAILGILIKWIRSTMEKILDHRAWDFPEVQIENVFTFLAFLSRSFSSHKTLIKIGQEFFFTKTAN